MGDVLALVITSAVVIGAIVYVVRAKKRGQACIGCPHAACCPKSTCSDTSCNSCDFSEKNT